MNKLKTFFILSCAIFIAIGCSSENGDTNGDNTNPPTDESEKIVMTGETDQYLVTVRIDTTNQSCSQFVSLAKGGDSEIVDEKPSDNVSGIIVARDYVCNDGKIDNILGSSESDQSIEELVREQYNIVVPKDQRRI